MQPPKVRYLPCSPSAAILSFLCLYCNCLSWAHLHEGRQLNIALHNAHPAEMMKMRSQEECCLWGSEQALSRCATQPMSAPLHTACRRCSAPPQWDTSSERARL